MENSNHHGDSATTTVSESKTVSRVVEHLLSVKDVCERLETSVESGLTHQEAMNRLERDGLNTFTPPKSKPWYWLLFREMTSGFALLLWFAGIASFISSGIDKKKQDAYLGAVLIFTVLLTALFSFYQQSSSSKVFKSFKNLTPQSTYVIRNGKKQLIPVEELVVGDLVCCQAGDRIPADIRIVQSDQMKVDNSSITGESEPLVRTVEQAQALTNSLEADNLAFFSTNCIDGGGRGVVIATGDRTVMGDIASIVTGIEDQPTPIAKEISSFVTIITVISVLSGLLFFGMSYAFGSDFFAAFLFMIGITVGNVPEGLLPALTVALTLTAKRMAAKKCLVKHLEAVETLGSTSTICTDKTGTLTQNRMTVEHLWFGSKVYIYRNGQIKSDVCNREQIKDKCDWAELKRCAMLCSRAEFLDENELELDIDQRKCSGDASELAILKFCEVTSVGETVEQYRKRFPKVAEKPFNSTNKYQYSIHRKPSSINGKFLNYFLVMKGAPERIISMCTTRVNHHGDTVPIKPDYIKEFEEMYREFGSAGERVLAFCDRDYTCDEYDEEFNFKDNLDNNVRLGDLRFLGLISMMDPPRPNVPEAVGICRNAGIRVVMVTGDHPITAQAIAKMVGIITSSHRSTTSITSLSSSVSQNRETGQRSIIVPGDKLNEMSPDELREVLLLYGEIVFARTSPKQKLQIVEAFQSLGEIVAVTGDGVNDSPALKKADIGVAMGITGSEVSKQAADMILLDDNFSTIVVGIEEGRRIFDNMKKTVSYILSGNVTTIYPFVVYASLGFPLAISTVTALLIALGTDIVPAISLSYETAEQDIMNLKPRNSKTDRLVDRSLLLRAYLLFGIFSSSAAFFAYFVTMYNHGFNILMLFNARERWEDENSDFPRIGGYIDGKVYYATTTLEERQLILTEAQSAYFCGIVIVQWMDVIVCKTRRVSIFDHGMKNWVLNMSILFETCLAAALVYTPQLNDALQTAPVSWNSLIWVVPFIGLILVLEEIRKLIIRNYPDSFFGKELLA